MSGTLSRGEIEFCFGPKWLDLDVAQNDMDDFIEVVTRVVLFHCCIREESFVVAARLTNCMLSTCNLAVIIVPLLPLRSSHLHALDSSICPSSNLQYFYLIS